VLVLTSDFSSVVSRTELARVARVSHGVVRAAAHGDRYAGAWPREQFTKSGISYEVCEQSKSELYREVLPSINSRTLALLDHPRMVTQFCGLERRVARGGGDSIDHGPTWHDDVVNAVTGAVILAAASARVTTRLGPDQCQFLSAYGLQMFEKPAGEFTCATCASFEATTSRCHARRIGTRGELLACEVYEVRGKTSP